MTSVPARRSFDWTTAAAALAGSVASGYLLMKFALPVVHDRYFPWIVARACGMSAYVALVALVVQGMWLRHPWRCRFGWPHAETQLRLHATTGIAVAMLVGAHLVALAFDKWAGVGWLGTVVPLRATYRPGAVAVGVIAMYGLVALIVTARFGGRLVGRRWLGVHRLALPIFVSVWFHGMLAGTDTPRLRAAYAVSGVLVLAVGATRLFAKGRG